MFDIDLVAERFRLALQSASAVLDRVAFALPVGTELAEWDLVADEVVRREAREQGRRWRPDSAPRSYDELCHKRAPERERDDLAALLKRQLGC